MAFENYGRKMALLRRINQLEGYLDKHWGALYRYVDQVSETSTDLQRMRDELSQLWAEMVSLPWSTSDKGGKDDLLQGN